MLKKLKNRFFLMACLVMASFASITVHAEGTTATPAVTPMDQRYGSDKDIEMTRQIRNALVGMKELSLSAQNIKIVTLDGKVHLSGEVPTMKEKETVLQTAKKFAGKNITEEITIHR